MGPQVHGPTGSMGPQVHRFLNPRYLLMSLYVAFGSQPHDTTLSHTRERELRSMPLIVDEFALREDLLCGAAQSADLFPHRQKEGETTGEQLAPRYTLALQ